MLDEISNILKKTIIQFLSMEILVKIINEEILIQNTPPHKYISVQYVLWNLHRNGKVSTKYTDLMQITKLCMVFF